MLPDLQEFAVPFQCPAPYAEITFYMLPFRNLDSSLRAEQLNGLSPHFRYYHRGTKQERFDLPPGLEHLSAKELAESQWEITDLWSATESNFVNVEPRTVSIEFADFTDATLPEIKLFAYYWESASRLLSTRWEWFRQMVSIEIMNQWVSAYNAAEQTRAAYRPPEKPKDAKSPLASSGGNMSDSSGDTSNRTGAASPSKAGEKNQTRRKNSPMATTSNS